MWHTPGVHCHANNMPVSEQVLKLNPRLASLDILCVGPRPLDTAFSAIIRHAAHPFGCTLACCAVPTSKPASTTWMAS